MRRLIVTTLLAWTLGGSIAWADGPMAEPAARAWAISDAVLTSHVDPPSRQEMLLAGLKALAIVTRGSVPDGLARRVSNLSGPDQLATLLAELLPDANAKVAKLTQSPEDVFFEGMLSVVPGEAALLSEKERKVQESFEANLYVGVQVRLGLDEKAKRPVFLEILEGGPAEAAGARSGDLIESIDGTSTAGMPLASVVDRLRGAEGTDVMVGFRRPEAAEVFTKPMTRGRLPRATVQGIAPLPGRRWSVKLDGPAPIGYLKLTEVSGSTPQELRAFAEQLESEGVKALVLDLRTASTLHFHPSLLLADALLDGGVIGRVKTSGGEKTYQAEPDALFREWPMVVLAAGSHQPEVGWLCAALKDNHRATIVGEPRILGQGFVTETVPLPGSEWSVKLATGRLARSDGQPIGRGPKLDLRSSDMAELERKTTEILALSAQKTAEANRMLAETTAEASALLKRMEVGLNPIARTDPAALEDQLKALTANRGPQPGGGPAPDRDLARAREILEQALKSKR